MNLKQRIKKTDDFKVLIENRKFVKTSSSIIYFKSKTLDLPRFGLSVSKKIGNAVVRNAIKRRYRAIISSIQSEEINFDLVIIARPQINNMTYQETKLDVSGGIEKIREKTNEQKA